MASLYGQKLLVITMCGFLCIVFVLFSILRTYDIHTSLEKSFPQFIYIYILWYICIHPSSRKIKKKKNTLNCNRYQPIAKKTISSYFLLGHWRHSILIFFFVILPSKDKCHRLWWWWRWNREQFKSHVFLHLSTSQRFVSLSCFSFAFFFWLVPIPNIKLYNLYLRMYVDTWPEIKLFNVVEQIFVDTN